jgi:predicted ATP-dependent Lon-type protease
MNFDLRHRLANNGTTDRIHLVIDCIVNDWMHQLFSSAKEEDVKRIAATEKFSVEEQHMMIAQLKNMGTDTAISLAKSLEEEIANKL